MIEESTMKSQFDLLKKLVKLEPETDSLMARAKEIEKIIRDDLPKELEKEAPPNLPALCFDLQEVYEQFEDFLVFRDLIGKRIVALGGGFSTGKSSFLNGILGEGMAKRVHLLPVETEPTTAVPTYLLHAPDEVKVTAINMFDSRISGLTATDVGTIGHNFETDNPGVKLGQLIQRIFIATPLQSYDHIAFLDTPGYSKPDTEYYSARTDEKIAREQLNHSDFILWFVVGSSIRQSDIEFLKGLDASIPKAVILNQADKVLAEGMDTYREVISSIRKDLAKNGISVKGVWGYTKFPNRRREILDDVAAIHSLLRKLNQKKEKSRFGHDFMKLFVACGAYYRKELSKEEARLKRVNQAILLSDKEEVRDNLEDSRLALTTRIGRLNQASDNLASLKTRFFDLIRQVAGEVDIDIPAPSELELAEENAADPAGILSQLMKEKGISEDPILVEKLRKQLEKLDGEPSALPGSAGYEKRLFDLLKSKLEQK